MEVLELCRPPAVPRAAEPPANLSQAPETPNQQPWGSLVTPGTAVTRQTQTTPALFQKRKNSDPVHLNISLLQEVLSVQSLQLAPSVYLRILLKIVLMLICIIQMPYNSCLMMTNQRCALCEIRNLKMIIKLLGLMGDETRVIHQQKINP